MFSPPLSRSPLSSLWRSAVALATLSVLAGCASISGENYSGKAALDLGPAGQYEKDKTYKITILHTNDHHGRFWRNSSGEYGLAARKTLIDRVRSEIKAQGGYSLLLDGGDVNTGVPESDTQDAEPDFRGMSAAGYDAMAVGNHEFDKPLTVLARQMNWTKFPVLSANIYRGDKRMFDPYTLFNLGGVKVAVMGLTTEDTHKMVLPANVRGITFRNTQQETAQLLPQLRSKADVVIATTHMGHYTDGKSGTQAPGDVELARAVKGLNMIVGGHSQNPVCMQAENVRVEKYVPGDTCKPDQQNGTWIVQAHEWGKYVGRADFEFRNGEFKLMQYALLPVNLMKTVKGADGKDSKTPYTEKITEDASMLRLLQPFQDKGASTLSQPLGALEGDLDGDRANVRSKPTNLGVMIARSMQERTKADFSIMNSGGVRDSIKAGTVTYRDVIKVQPFGNTIVYVDLSGQEALDLLAASAKMSKGSGAFPQYSGVQLVIEGDKLISAKIDGKDIDTQKTYRVALNNFVADGGDGYPRLSTHKGYVNTGFVDAEVLRSLFTSGKTRAADYAPGDAVTRR